MIRNLSFLFPSASVKPVQPFFSRSFLLSTLKVYLYDCASETLVHSQRVTNYILKMPEVWTSKHDQVGLRLVLKKKTQQKTKRKPLTWVCLYKFLSKRKMNPFYDICIRKTKCSIPTLSLVYCVIVQRFNFSLVPFLFMFCHLNNSQQLNFSLSHFSCLQIRYNNHSFPADSQRTDHMGLLFFYILAKFFRVHG